jgi:hypothetical protein
LKLIEKEVSEKKWKQDKERKLTMGAEGKKSLGSNLLFNVILFSTCLIYLLSLESNYSM